MVGGLDEFGLFQVRLPGDDAQAVLEVIAVLESAPEFKAVVPNVIPGFPGQAVVPDVPQWKGQDNKKRWGQAYINLPAAWGISRGGPELKIGIVDTGFDLDHPDLSRVTRVIAVDGKAWSSKDLFHGTYVVSIIGANAHNKWGMSGVVWEAQLHCYQISSFSAMWRVPSSLPPGTGWPCSTRAPAFPGPRGPGERSMKGNSSG